MISKLIECTEHAALRLSPERARKLFAVGLSEPMLRRMQSARFRRTVRLAAERSPFYRDEFRRRGIDARGRGFSQLR